MVGKPNEFAYACARRVAEQPASQGFNPLFLYGGVGLGKTHLMHAVGLELCRRDNARPATVVYMSAEKFMYRFIAAIRAKSTMDFKDSMRSVDVLMVDDVQFLIGKDSTQEEFFHTFNFLVDAGKQIVISSDKSPSELDVEHRLRTRLGCGMVADIHATTFELRVSILDAKAARAGVEVPRRVLEFLAHKITTNVRELEGALNRLVAHASLFGRAVTMESDPGGAARRAEGARPQGDHRGNPEARRRALSHAAERDEQRPPRPQRGAAAAGGDVPVQAAHPAARCPRSAASSATATTPPSCTPAAGSPRSWAWTPVSPRTWSCCGACSNPERAMLGPSPPEQPS